MDAKFLGVTTKTIKTELKWKDAALAARNNK